MSLIQHTFLPRRMFDMDLWVPVTPFHTPAPSTLDLFDPFDDLDRAMARNFSWLSRPAELGSLLGLQQPRVPNKYRINVDCHGYHPNSIKIDTSEDGRKLVVTGQEGSEKPAGDNDDFSHRRFRRTFNLPADLAVDRMASFVTSNGHLVIEIPFKEQEQEKVAANKRGGLFDEFAFPKIVEDGENGQKSVTMSITVPEGLDASKIKVTCKDRDVIVQAEDTKQEQEEGDKENKSRVSQSSFYYRRCTLPENTNFDALKCVYDNGKLTLKAPLNQEALKDKAKVIPIEMNAEKKK